MFWTEYDIIKYLFNPQLVVLKNALECGFDRLKKYDMEKVLSICMNNNGSTPVSNEAPVTTESSLEDRSGENNNGTVAKNTGDKFNTNKDNNDRKSRRNKRSASRGSNKSASRGSNKSNETRDINNSEEESDESREFSEKMDNKCMVQCVLKEMDLTDRKGVPDQRKITDALERNGSGREFQNFVQKTLDDCFEEMNSEMESCDYSTKLVSCMAEIGKSNCADWPAGSLPF